jgi:hypothetical protein
MQDTLVGGGFPELPTPERTIMHGGPLLTAVGFLLVLVGAAALADFPEPAKLPANPDLPDPLLMMNGERVKTKEDWTKKRRPELKALFQHYMYGNMPDAPEKISAKVEREDRKYFDGKATKKEVTIAFGPPDTPKVHLLLVIPNDRKKATPVFVGMNFHGNYTVTKDPTIPLPTAWVPNGTKGVNDNKASEDGRGVDAAVWDLEDVVGHGYAVATFYCGDVDPDRADKREGVQVHYLKKGETKPDPNDWGTIAAWSWGLSRAVDYLVTDADLDRERIIAVGHSRLGKAAMVAGAFDERIALIIPHQAGCGGTAPSRGKVGESVKQINDRFPHWFDANFKEFNDKVDRLPFDQNCLVALAAPRPVLFTNGVEDEWANPKGQFQVLQGADSVYRLLGVEGLEAKEMPEPNKLIASRLGYHIRPGKHSMGKEDWKVWIEFADKHLGK